MASFPGGSISGNITPSNDGQDLGTVSKSWDINAKDVNVKGTLTVPGSIVGNLVGGVTGNVTGDVTGNGKFKGVPWFDVEAYGAACDGVTNDDAAVALARAAAEAAHGIMYFPAGKTTLINTAILSANGYWGIIGGPGAKLKYTGAGIALKIDGSAIGNGAGNVLLRDFAIEATSGTNALYLKKVCRSLVSNVECRGCTAEAFIFDFCVSVAATNLAATSNNGAFTATPTKGILVTNAAGSASSNNTFINPIMEGIGGHGIAIHGSNANTFIGGTSEGNTGNGIFIDGTSISNTFINTDIESNSGTHDIELADASIIRGTQFINMTVGRDLMVGTASKETTIHGGNINTITINAGATATNLYGAPRYSTLTDNGTATNRFGENLAVANTLGVTNFGGGGWQMDSAGGLMTNNIPLRGKTSAAATINVLWLTSADQTLVQYLATKALKVRNHNGTTQMTVDDAATTLVGNLVIAPSATTATITASTGAASFNGGVTAATDSSLINSTSNGATWTRGSSSELLTLSTSGLTTDTTANLLPANSIIEAVVCRVTTTITTTTNWAVGDATQSARFSTANATLIAGTTSVGQNHKDPTVATANLGPVQTSAAKVRITCTGSNPGAGAVRITVFYQQFVAPSS
jgi:hypothetical protein